MSDPKPFSKENLPNTGKKPAKLYEKSFRVSEFVRTVWAATPEPGITLEELAEPGYWTHIASKLKRGDRIEVVPEDGTFFAEFYVRSANNIEAFVSLLRHTELAKPAPKPVTNPDYEIRHVGGGRWRILRTADKQELKTGFKSKDEAEFWLAQYLKDKAA